MDIPSNLTVMEQPGIQQAAIKRAKESRFTLSARVLTQKQIDVKVIDDPSAHPASYNTFTKLLELNEAIPVAKSAIEALVYDRAKLYHELGHAMWTKGGRTRKNLVEASSNPEAFMAVSNILEDGRIERLLKMRWGGSGDYLNALLVECVKGSTSDSIGGLVLYVRTGKWRTAAEAKFWQPYEAEIDKAIRAKSTRSVCEIANDIVERAFPKPRQEPEPEQPSPNPSNESGEGKGEEKQPGQPRGEGESEGEQPEQSQPGEAGEGETGEQGEAAKGQSEQDNESADSGGPSDGGDGDGKAEAEPEPGKTEPEQGQGGENVAGDGSGADASKGEPVPENVLSENEIQDITSKAFNAVESECESDWQGILEQAASEEPIQEFSDAAEESTSDDIATLFESLLTESARTRFTATREGLLNNLALTNALTNRRCFHTRDEQPSTPRVALLLDCSGSMLEDSVKLTKAARILNGSLMKAKIDIRTITFQSDTLTQRVTVPSCPFRCYGGTPTGEAMQVANDWLEENQSSRGLILVVTDGQPQSVMEVRIQLERAHTSGTYVLGILTGGEMAEYDRLIAEARGNAIVELYHRRKDRIMSAFDSCFDSFIQVADIADLPQALEPKLAAFLAGE